MCVYVYIYVLQIADSLIECYSTSRCWHKYPGTGELLESLSRRRPRVVLGVISNFDERLEAVLDDARIRSYFSFVITSYGLGVEKPSPAIFQVRRQGFAYRALLSWCIYRAN